MGNAPVKGQCARDYFYGKDDLTIEQRLIQLEGEYARIIVRLERGESLSEIDTQLLNLFFIVQMRRTELALEQMKAFNESMVDKAAEGSVFENKQDYISTDRELILGSMQQAGNLVRHVDDLKVVILKNKTKIDFVTSDNPAAMTNRFHFEKLKLNYFGPLHSGTIISMPVNRRLSFIAYDKGVYSLPNGSGSSFVELGAESDVRAINELQFLSANRNIYFSNWNDASRIKHECDQVQEERAKSGPISTAYVETTEMKDGVLTLRDPTDGTTKSYRPITADDEPTLAQVVHTSFSSPKPKIWLSKLRMRNEPQTHYNGSGVGHVRRAEWLYGY